MRRECQWSASRRCKCCGSHSHGVSRHFQPRSNVSSSSSISFQAQAHHAQCVERHACWAQSAAGEVGRHIRAHCRCLPFTVSHHASSAKQLFLTPPPAAAATSAALCFITRRFVSQLPLQILLPNPPSNSHAAVLKHPFQSFACSRNGNRLTTPVCSATGWQLAPLNVVSPETSYLPLVPRIELMLLQVRCRVCVSRVSHVLQLGVSERPYVIKLKNRK